MPVRIVILHYSTTANIKGESCGLKDKKAGLISKKLSLKAKKEAESD